MNVNNRMLHLKIADVVSGCVCVCELPATTSTPTQASIQDTSNPCTIRHTKQPQYKPHAATAPSASLLQPYAARQQNITTAHTNMLDKNFF
jgi:hypothetical protein